jgi:hypothetical protein
VRARHREGALLVSAPPMPLFGGHKQHLPCPSLEDSRGCEQFGLYHEPKGALLRG